MARCLQAPGASLKPEGTRMTKGFETTTGAGAAGLREQALGAVRRGLENLARRQTAAGSWKGDYGGPVFLVPMYVALHRVTGRTIPEPRRSRIAEYLMNVRTPDGGLPLHAEGDAMMFPTATGYVALRSLGVPRDDPRLVAMRAWIRRHGSPLGAAQWGKFTLAWQNLYEWDGLHPIPPELWLLPRASPFHPGRMWCHARVVYLPMAWLWGTRSRAPVDDLCRELRADLYDRPYAEVQFARHRGTIAPTDCYAPPTPLLRVANRLLGLYEQAAPGALRRRALAEVMRHIEYEDETTGHVNLGPVNAILNRVCHHFADPTGGRLAPHWERLDEYVWDDDGGCRINGYQSTELWDTAFAVQAVLASPLAEAYERTLSRAAEFIRDNQVLEDTPDHEAFFRHASRGGWPFSTRVHGWPITDCTGEGLKVAIALEGRVASPVPEVLMRDAVRLLLSFQNADGGWASYELQRGGDWLELLNPSGVFSDIMVEHSYAECTSSAMQGLVSARRRFGASLGPEVDRAIERGVGFLRGKQRPDGSFEGSWAVCFTYGTWFAVTGLAAAGVPPSDPAMRAAVRFLLERQRPDGGWGEHHRSCTERRWVPHPEGQVVNTSWALMALLRAGCEDHEAMARAASFLIERQSPDGGWPRQAIAGVFNRTCLINYDNYRHYFPVWALSEWLGAEGAC